MYENYPRSLPEKDPNIFHQRCPSNAVLDMIADKWTALIVARLYLGKQRHSELQRAIDGISQRMLTQTLRELERNGFVSRTVHPVIPPHVDYELTPLGRSLYTDALKPLTLWAIDHMSEVAQARAAFDGG